MQTLSAFFLLKADFREGDDQKSLGVRKFPTPKRAQNEEKLYKLVENPQNWHFFGGGGTQFYGQNDFMDIWAFLRWGQQLFSFHRPAVHWMARTSSLNCLSCRYRYQTSHSLNASPLSAEKLFLSLKSASSHPLPKNRLLSFNATRREKMRP